MDNIENHHGSVSRSFSHKPYALNHNPNPSTSNPVPRRFRSRDQPQFPRHSPNLYGGDDDDDDDDSDELDEDEDDENQGFGNGGGDFYRHPKKRRLRSLNSSYELAPRAGNGNGGDAERASAKGRGFSGAEEEWSERGALVLLEVWGERFVQLGRRSLRSEDWREVAERVSEVWGLERTESQCRSMMDLLKRKYRKEKARVDQLPGPRASRWGHFRKMDTLLAPPQAPRQALGLACGVDSGEFVFTNPKVYLDQSNGQDEMRDSPAESEDENGSDSDGTPPRRGGEGGGPGASLASMRALADSIHKFGEIYGKIESSKRQQMVELENMRREFCRDLELQKKQIMERTQAEIAKIREEEEEDDEDLSE